MIDDNRQGWANRVDSSSCDMQLALRPLLSKLADTQRGVGPSRLIRSGRSAGAQQSFGRAAHNAICASVTRYCCMSHGVQAMDPYTNEMNNKSSRRHAFALAVRASYSRSGCKPAGGGQDV